MKRKQVKKACVNCQKSHAACDESRPCSRCITLNLANSCEDAGRRKKQKYSPTDSTSNPASAYMNSFLNFVPPSTPTSGQPASSPVFVDFSPNSSSASSFMLNSGSLFPTKFNSETPIPQQQDYKEYEEEIASLKMEIEDLKKKLQQSEEESERWKVQCEKLFAVLRLRTECSLDGLLSDLKSATSNLQHVQQFQIDSPSSLIGPSSFDTSLFRNRSIGDRTPMTNEQISKLFAFCFEKSQIPISITGISGAADKVIACNDAFKKAFGLTTKPNVSDYTWKELLHPVFWRIMMQEWINFAQVNLLQYKTRAKCCHVESGKYFIMETQVDTICDENNIPLFNLNYIIGRSELFDEIPKVQPMHPSGIEFSIPPLLKDRVFEEQPLYSSPMIDMVSIVEKKLQNTNSVPPSSSSVSSGNWNEPVISKQPSVTQSTQHYIQPFASPPQAKILPSLNNLIVPDPLPGVNSSFIPIQSLQQQQQQLQTTPNASNIPPKLSNSTLLQQHQPGLQQEKKEWKKQYPF